MKILWNREFRCLPLILLTIIPTVENGQTPSPVPDSQSQTRNYSLAERGLNHRVWQKVTADGITNSYNELETGMHRLVNGNYIECSPDILPVVGGAAATNCAHQVFFATDANTAVAVKVTTPDGKTISSHVMGLAYFDYQSKSNVLIAELQSAPGQLLPPDEVLYADALVGDCTASLLYKNSKAGLEQNVIIHTIPPPASAYGLNPSSTMLQIWSEFSPDSPEPDIALMTSKAGITDQQLDFGVMKISAGGAFLFGIGADPAKQVHVLKEWVVLNGRRFLVEQLHLNLISKQLQQLPSANGTNQPTGAMLHRTPKKFPPVPTYAKKGSSKPLVVAGIAVKAKPGFLTDYPIVLVSDTNFTFHGDSTYYCSGTVNLSGTTVLEGGAVINFTNTTAAVIYLRPTTNDVPLLCKTGPYRMAVFTSKDDDSLGLAIGGSTGVIPTNNVTVYMHNFSSTTDATVKYVRFAYASTGFIDWTDDGPTFWHCQFVGCTNCTIPTDALYATMHNVLAWQCGDLTYGCSVVGEHITADNCGAVVGSDDFNVSAVTNSLITAVGYTNQVTFWNSVVLPSATGVYQTAGAGGHYLATNSPYRNLGTAAIDTNLLSDLKRKTTYPPLVFSNVIVTADTVLAPQVQRDSDTLDLGFHYDPIDYMTYSYAVSNASLTITNGAVIGYFDNTGVRLADWAQINCIGSPTALNRFADYRTVQEQQVHIGSYSAGTGWPVIPYRTSTVGMPGTFRFTAFSRMAPSASAYDLYVGGNWRYSTLTVADCWFGNATCNLVGDSGDTMVLRNNDFEREGMIIGFTDAGSNSVSIYNNLFRFGTTYFDNEGSAQWLIRDNSFDTCPLFDDSLLASLADHNAYIGGGYHIYGDGTNDVVLTNFVYATGPLGDRYQVSTNLINAGSRTADLAGLYHYTTGTNLVSGLEVKETNSVVDIGLHYIAVGANGQPIDTDGDLIPDYLEDANGNGAVDSGETDWHSATDVGLKVMILRPSKQSLVP